MDAASLVWQKPSSRAIYDEMSERRLPVCLISLSSVSSVCVSVPTMIKFLQAVSEMNLICIMPSLQILSQPGRRGIPGISRELGCKVRDFRTSSSSSFNTRKKKMKNLHKTLRDSGKLWGRRNGKCPDLGIALRLRW